METETLGATLVESEGETLAMTTIYSSAMVLEVVTSHASHALEIAVGINVVEAVTSAILGGGRSSVGLRGTTVDVVVPPLHLVHEDLICIANLQ